MRTLDDKTKYGALEEEGGEIRANNGGKITNVPQDGESAVLIDGGKQTRSEESTDSSSSSNKPKGPIEIKQKEASAHSASPYQDIMNAARASKEKYRTAEERAVRNSKIAAMTNFFVSLSAVAGKGDAPIQATNGIPSYLKHSLAETARLQEEGRQSDLQYAKQASDYAKQGEDREFKQSEADKGRVHDTNKLGATHKNTLEHTEVKNAFTEGENALDRNLKSEDMKADQGIAGEKIEIERQRVEQQGIKTQHDNNAKAAGSKWPMVVVSGNREYNVNQSMVSGIFTKLKEVYSGLEGKDAKDYTPLEKRVANEFEFMERNDIEGLGNDDNTLRELANTYVTHHPEDFAKILKPSVEKVKPSQTQTPQASVIDITLGL